MFLKKTFKNGLPHTLSTFTNRFKVSFRSKIKTIYSPVMKISDLNKIPIEYLKNFKPNFVITNACQLLSKKLIKKLQSLGAEIINIHNGINPRYRGTGNLWAFYERNFGMTGVTLHKIDQGIDTGKIILSKKINFLKKNVSFENTDTLAFRTGARLAIKYIFQKRLKNIDQRKPDYRSRLYSYPSEEEYRKAKARFEAAKKNKTFETDWRKSFVKLSSDSSKNIYQRQHWGNFKSVNLRDSTIITLVNKFGKGNNLIDLGCGDGRYNKLFRNYKYWGLDYSLNTIKLKQKIKPAKIHKFINNKNCHHFTDYKKNHYIIASVNKIPLKSSIFHKTLAIGLFQHIDNTGGAADEILRISKKGGYIFINTLRQFSKLELVVVAIICLFRPSLLKMISAIWNEKYFSKKTIKAVKLARRFKVRELRQLFFPHAEIQKIKYTGLFNTRLFSREIFLVLKKK